MIAPYIKASPVSGRVGKPGLTRSLLASACGSSRFSLLRRRISVFSDSNSAARRVTLHSPVV